MRKTTYVCDVCKKNVTERELVAVKVDDGDPHPHNGSTWETDADVCVDCLRKASKKMKPCFGNRTILDIKQAGN
jgi:hypothetical protein